MLGLAICDALGAPF